MTTMHNVNVDFLNIDGQPVSLTIERAWSVVYSDTTQSLTVQSSDTHLILKGAAFKSITRFDSRTVESTVSEWQRRDMDADVRQLLRDRQKISGIKLVRTVLGYDLKGAKEYVERIEREPTIDYNDIPF